MNNELSQAFSLLGIGMITVFVVLALVVIIGNVLIRLVNRMTPPTPISSVSESSISGSKIAAITAAVDIVTEGNGRVTQIERE